MKYICRKCGRENERDNDRPFACAYCGMLVDPIEDSHSESAGSPQCVIDSINNGNFIPDSEREKNNGFHFRRTISGYEVCSCTAETESIIIPGEYNGEPVTGIANGAFKGSRIRTVIVPDNVRIIGDRAFADCIQLVFVTTGKGLEAIGSEAFMGCIRLRMLNLSSIPTVVSSAFAGCYELDLAPNSVQYLPQ